MPGTAKNQPLIRKKRGGKLLRTGINNRVKSATERVLQGIVLEPRNRYVTLNCATGEYTQHATRGQATLAFLQIMNEIDCEAPRPQILEWCAGKWKAV